MRAYMRREGVPLYVWYLCDICVHVCVSCVCLCRTRVYLCMWDICVRCVCVCVCVMRVLVPREKGERERGAKTSYLATWHNFIKLKIGTYNTGTYNIVTYIIYISHHIYHTYNTVTYNSDNTLVAYTVYHIIYITPVIQWQTTVTYFGYIYITLIIQWHATVTILWSHIYCITSYTSHL